MPVSSRNSLSPACVVLRSMATGFYGPALLVGAIRSRKYVLRRARGVQSTDDKNRNGHKCAKRPYQYPCACRKSWTCAGAQAACTLAAARCARAHDIAGAYLAAFRKSAANRPCLTRSNPHRCVIPENHAFGRCKRSRQQRHWHCTTALPLVRDATSSILGPATCRFTTLRRLRLVPYAALVGNCDVVDRPLRRSPRRPPRAMPSPVKYVTRAADCRPCLPTKPAPRCSESCPCTARFATLSFDL
jgi:hypothetical protein